MWKDGCTRNAKSNDVDFTSGDGDGQPREQWLSNHVQVMRSLPDRLDPVFTGNLPFHKIIVPLTPAYVSKSINGTYIHRERLLTPSEAAVWSRAAAQQDVLTGWRSYTHQPYGFIGVMLSTEQVSNAARTLGVDYQTTEFVPLSICSDPVINGLSNALAAEMKSHMPAGRVYADQLLQTMSIHLTAKYTVYQPKERAFDSALTPKQVHRIQVYAHTSLEKDIGLAELAAQVSLSEYYFARQFKNATGETPAFFIRRLRMKKAMHLIKTRPHLTLAAIAARVGYVDPSSFTKAFRQCVGVNPSVYRHSL